MKARCTSSRNPPATTATAAKVNAAPGVVMSASSGFSGTLRNSGATRERTANAAATTRSAAGTRASPSSSSERMGRRPTITATGCSPRARISIQTRARITAASISDRATT